MADISEGKSENRSRSVPSSPVVIKPFVTKTPIPRVYSPEWKEGAPTPILTGDLSPNTEAFSLLTGFASGEVTMDGSMIKHIPVPPVHGKSISEQLDELPWNRSPKRKQLSNGKAIRNKKPKIAEKEPRHRPKQPIAEKTPRTRVPDSEIRLDNIIPGSPLYIPIRVKTKGKGKGCRDIKILSDSSMARRKQTPMKAEKDALEKKRLMAVARANGCKAQAKKAAKLAKPTPKSVPKSRKMANDASKVPREAARHQGCS